jgi:hypothetical protein
VVKTRGGRRSCCGTRGTDPHECFPGRRGHWDTTRRSVAAGNCPE